MLIHENDKLVEMLQDKTPAILTREVIKYWLGAVMQKAKVPALKVCTYSANDGDCYIM